MGSVITNSVKLDTFKPWVQKILPLVYDDSLSYYEVLSKMCDYLNKVIESNNELIDTYSESGTTIENLKKDVTYLQSELEKVKNGDYVSLYINSLATWIDKNLQELVGKVVRYVTFGLTNDGHFIANIPETWEFIEFDTVMDTSDSNYGCLVLRY